MSKLSAAERELRQQRHEWACRSVTQGSEDIRFMGGRWQVRRGGEWRTLDPVLELGEPV